MGRCDALKKAFNVNGQDVPATYTYANIENNQKIEHFAITDAKCVNGMVQHLKLDFTLVLQNDIKVWAANIKHRGMVLPLSSYNFAEPSN